MNNQKQLLQHHAFIATTDRKSLFTQLKNLVQQAQEVANKELEQRRNNLKLLLEHEDQVYEEEFANKVKSRIDEDIKERKDNLIKIKEESTKAELEFLKSKRIQQYMNSCYEIREALRHKETLHLQECHLEQMLEKDRLTKKEKDLEQHWLNVQKRNIELIDEQQKREDRLKKALIQQVGYVRSVQLEEVQEKREKEKQEKLKEKNKIDALLEELRLEAFDSTIRRKSSEKAKYGEELLNVIKEKEHKKANDFREEAEIHRKLINDIQREKAEETLAIREKKKAFYKATMDFIKFVQGVRQLEEQHEQMLSNRIEELGLMDRCTKRNILLERQRKARIAEKCYAELREQIGEKHKARLLEEAEYRENKMLENRFIHQEISRKEIVSKKQKFRKELDKQIEELKLFRESENAKFSNDLQRASNDPDFCADLALKYIEDGTDYLEPHPNWNIISSPSHECVTKESAQGHGAIPKLRLGSCDKKHKILKDGRGDE